MPLFRSESHNSAHFVACLLMLSASACNQGNTSERKPADKFKGESVKQIRAAYGVTDCHVGMPIEELGEGWVKKHDGYLFNKKTGIGVSFEDDVVIHVTFKYLGNDLTPCRLTTEKSISSQATRNEVIDAYGEPSYVSKTTVSEFGEFPDATNVGVNCVEDGIDFDFIDGKLESIGVYEPVADFDYESLRGPRQDWVIFVRPSDSKRIISSAKP